MRRCLTMSGEGQTLYTDSRPSLIDCINGLAIKCWTSKVFIIKSHPNLLLSPPSSIPVARKYSSNRRVATLRNPLRMWDTVQMHGKSVLVQ